ncbi:uncharacterized protein LOC125943208 [Dermacentor silvarum]|uniref:uncharacterized protein LOC125943208 n=1 Tax=Dermacentor silvarum TaxID=543639 RepID=UPI0021011C6D|nr:uncharacterized protein LOC125943208 [Dermacentor silvarum]
MSQFDSSKHEIEALEVPFICDHLLEPPQSQSFVQKLANEKKFIADFVSLPGLKTEVGISLLIGADQMWKLVLNDVWSHDEVTGLAAINTKLGWTFQGPVPCDGRIFKEGRAHVCVLRTSCTETDVSESLQHFWELDSIGISDPSTHDEHGNEVVRQFTENIALKNGRCEVALPWKSVNTYLADNRSVAVRCLHGLLRRFGSNEELLQQYDKEVRQYELDDHAERVNGKDSAERCYYMPHRAVIRESSSTTRLRVVFDASSNAHRAASLNELLEKGPKINNNMVKMLVNFRLHKIAITADVQKAFLQIGIQEPDRDALRFLWFDSTPISSEHVPKIVEYRMTRVPFGTTASPFLLSATLQYHFKHIDPALRSSAMQLAENFYVDDLVTGVPSSKEAFRLYNEANLILSKAGMKLQKWSTNDDEFRKYITDRLDSVSAIAPTKVLGLLWDTAADKLILNMESLLQILEKKNDTKRCVLQTAARIFDPLGWLSPFVVRMKVLFQRLCELKLLLDKPSSSQLHVFADASSVAYGAADTYAKGRAQLEVGQDLDKTSSIRDLHPFIDEKSIMRIRTRLQNADVTYNEKTPVLLPSNHPVTRLVILQAHKTVLHGGVDTLDVRAGRTGVFELGLIVWREALRLADLGPAFDGVAQRWLLPP